MASAHLTALKKKHEDIEKKIHLETVHAARDEQTIRKLKEEKLFLKEKIEKLQAEA